MTARALAAVLLTLAAPAHARAESVEQLDTLREQIEVSRERVERHEAAERGVFEQLDAIDRQMAELGAAVRRARLEATHAETGLRKIERETARLAGELERTRAAMAVRAVALYTTGEVGPLRVVFESSSLRELLQRASALQQLLAHDSQLVERYERDADAYDTARRDALRASERHQTAAARLRVEQAKLGREQAAKQRLLERIRIDRRGERRLLVELERAARALETTLAELGDAGRKHGRWLDGSGFARRRGELPLPVEAPIASRFGRVVDEDFLTQTVRNGVDFAAHEGASVRATANAEVRFAGWFRGYGKIVILDHGDAYFTISGHLSQIDVAVGERVGGGETIGSVGDTGSLSGPRLYFELRKGSEALDPADWLSADRLAEAR